jgi:hypothetical protein
MRYVWAALAALFLFCAFAGAQESHAFTVMAKTWDEVPVEYQAPHPNWTYYVGTWQSIPRNRQKNLYIHQIGRMGWHYKVKDAYGRTFTLYAGKEWTWSPGDKLVITGSISAVKVFIPQGERAYGN